jgi:putative selenate reductase
MSEKMTSIPYERLLERVCHEYEAYGTVFGVSRLWKAGDKKLPIFGQTVESPFGPAAGPNTQLAQNIVAAYAAGARFFELKTVQTLDGEDLAKCISRPCINAADEGYNCEWSTELTVAQAMDEYVKAWNILKIISKKYGFGDSDGFVFNMSVGYTLDGIRSEKITAFLDGMRGVSDSVTISTLHGCPPEEIERIANYLISERGLHTYVKCNPTLLGYDFARKTMDSLGYGYLHFDDHHFKEDLQWTDAVPMFRRLQALADEKGVEFGLKLTNTFPVDVKAGELPADEMYMSGRALFPLTAELARRVADAFGGALRISWAGGADAHNIASLYKAGIWPVTMATNILRPGGYNRMAQLAEMLAAQAYKPFAGVDVEAISAVARGALSDPWYRKPVKPLPNRKVPERVPLIDCFFAPCREGCPIRQDIPAYIRLCGEGRYLDALKVVTERNPLPNITGEICAHPCTARCTRSFYEGPVDIRACKLEAAEGAYGELLAGIQKPEPNGKRAAVVGAGPAGIASAYFLARAGYAVTVFEKAQNAGGIVRRVIPPFRIADEAAQRDEALAAAYGAEFRYNTEIRSPEQLKGYDAVVVCTGAWMPGKLPLEKGEAADVLEFLAQFRRDPEQCRLGRNVVVVGGGNTAMDAARAAKRCPGVETVSLVYRRDMRNMPADEAELREAMADGVIFRDLLSPVKHEHGRLTCERMVLGEPDRTGRRSPAGTGEFVDVEADTVLAAVGERTDSALYRTLGIALDEKGRAVLDPATQRSSDPRIYLAGDGAKGPSTVVEAVADAARAVKAITGADFEKYAPLNVSSSPAEALARKGVFRENCRETERCLECATVCEACVDVCPNRANTAVAVDGKIQILHLDGQCNECGNCETFCPWNSAPYRDKWTLFWDRESFDKGPNQGFLPLGKLNILCRFAGETFACDLGDGNGKLPAELAEFTRTVLLWYPELLKGD